MRENVPRMCRATKRSLGWLQPVSPEETQQAVAPAEPVRRLSHAWTHRRPHLPPVRIRVTESLARGWRVTVRRCTVCGQSVGTLRYVLVCECVKCVCVGRGSLGGCTRLLTIPTYRAIGGRQRVYGWLSLTL